VQQSQRLWGYEFPADLLSREMIFLQEQDFGACASSGNRASGACRAGADNDQIILGCFQTITPMRKRKNFLISILYGDGTGASILLTSSTV
jgi:hypothetical protein